MSALDRVARYLNERTEESDTQARARSLALRKGLAPVSPMGGQVLASLAAMSGAERILELGGGVGTTSLWLRRGAPSAHLTVLEENPERAAQAHALLREDGASSAAIRVIAGGAAEVLPRLSDGGYGLVVLADDPARFATHLAHALRLVAPGGTIIALGALRGGAVADPARRDPVTVAMREIMDELDRHPDFVTGTLPLEGGVLLLTRAEGPNSPR